MKLLQLLVVAALFAIPGFAQNHNPAHANNTADPAARHRGAGAGNGLADNTIAAGNRNQAAQDKQLAEIERRGSATHVKPAAQPKAAAKLPKEQAQRNPPIDFSYHPAKAQNAHAGNAHNSGYHK